MSEGCYAYSVCQVTYSESVAILAETDVLISSPGSDLMGGIYLKRGSAMIVVNYCRIVKPKGPCTSLMVSSG